MPERCVFYSKRSFKPGTQAMRDIKYLQRKYHVRACARRQPVRDCMLQGHLIPKSVIGRLVREIVGNNFYLSRTALHIIHSELEELACELFNKAGNIAYSHKKFTVRALQ